MSVSREFWEKEAEKMWAIAERNLVIDVKYDSENNVRTMDYVPTNLFRKEFTDYVRALFDEHGSAIRRKEV